MQSQSRKRPTELPDAEDQHLAVVMKLKRWKREVLLTGGVRHGTCLSNHAVTRCTSRCSMERRVAALALHLRRRSTFRRALM
eukprot:675772-Amphidinium_carterae.1